MENNNTAHSYSDHSEHASIKSWAEDDRPREKLLQKGRLALSDAELIAILLGSGSRGESAVDLAKRILKSVNNSLYELGKKSPSELQLYKGMGEAKAVSLVAALELGRRRQVSDMGERPRIYSSKDCYRLMAPLLSDLPHEEFWLLLLNRSNEVIGKERISSGGMSSTVVDMKMIFKCVLEWRAAGFVAIHNHPSGNATPSASDEKLTLKMVNAAKILDVSVLDHVIIAENAFYSFRDHDKV
jgi:DNA repair protein RadC